MRFYDRRDAGRILAMKLTGYAGRPDVLVLALPRGGGSGQTGSSSPCPSRRDRRARSFATRWTRLPVDRDLGFHPGRAHRLPSVSAAATKRSPTQSLDAPLAPTREDDIAETPQRRTRRSTLELTQVRHRSPAQEFLSWNSIGAKSAR
jgi:hypothetical protein